MKYYEVIRTQTSKPMGRTDQAFSTFNHEVKEFTTLKEAKEWLASEYYYCKTTSKMYVDTKSGSKEAGKIYSKKNSDYENGKTYHFYQQDWVEVREVNAKYTTIL